jgi:hypothetical protein
MSDDTSDAWKKSLIRKISEENEERAAEKVEKVMTYQY